MNLPAVSNVRKSHYYSAVYIQQHRYNLFKGRIISMEPSKVYYPPLGKPRGVTRLDLNENPFVGHHSCIDVLANMPEESLRFYGESQESEIATSFSRVLGTSPNRLTFNHGESEVLKQIFLSIANRGATVVICEPGWPYYASLCNLLNISLVRISMIDAGDQFNFPIEQLHDISNLAPDLLVLTSPHMPTGAVISYEIIGLVASRCPQTLVVLDEAYWGFDSKYRLGFFDIDHFLTSHPNIVITRTMSKFFGLAGIRVGFAWAHEEVIQKLSDYGSLFGLSTPAAQCGIAAVTHYSHYEYSSKLIEQARNNLAEFINGISGFVAYRSSANFLLVKCPENLNSHITDALREKGILVRQCDKYNIAQFVRISIGQPNDMTSVVEVFRELN